MASVEERVVLFFAKSATSALNKAVREARKYAKASTWLNAYGQTVRTQFLEAADCYDISDELREGTEVFSSLEAVPRSETAKRILARKRGAEPRRELARQFIAGAISDGLDEALGTAWRSSSGSGT
jgi:hypothetical protein